MKDLNVYIDERWGRGEGRKTIVRKPLSNELSPPFPLFAVAIVDPDPPAIQVQVSDVRVVEEAPVEAVPAGTEQVHPPPEQQGLPIQVLIL